jgi:hypothetical protein
MHREHAPRHPGRDPVQGAAHRPLDIRARACARPAREESLSPARQRILQLDRHPQPRPRDDRPSALAVQALQVADLLRVRAL